MLDSGLRETERALPTAAAASSDATTLVADM